MPYDGYDVPAIDTYSCDRPRLVSQSIVRGVVERETVVVVVK